MPANHLFYEHFRKIIGLLLPSHLRSVPIHIRYLLIAYWNVKITVLLSTPSTADDWDVAIVTLHKSFGAALDYNQSDDDKMKAIAAKHYKTQDEQKQREMGAKRLEMRDFKGTRYIREVTLKPMP